MTTELDPGAGAPAVRAGVVLAANTATYGGSASAVFFGLRADEFAAIAGVVIALIGLIVSWWYKAQHLRIAKERAARDLATEGDE